MGTLRSAGRPSFERVAERYSEDEASLVVSVCTRIARPLASFQCPQRVVVITGRVVLCCFSMGPPRSPGSARLRTLAVVTGDEYVSRADLDRDATAASISEACG